MQLIWECLSSGLSSLSHCGLILTLLLINFSFAFQFSLHPLEPLKCISHEYSLMLTTCTTHLLVFFVSMHARSRILNTPMLSVCFWGLKNQDSSSGRDGGTQGMDTLSLVLLCTLRQKQKGEIYTDMFISSQTRL